MDERSLAHSGGHYPRPDQEETPHACYNGWIYLGFEGEDLEGNHVEEIERVPCRRCQRSSDLAKNL